MHVECVLTHMCATNMTHPGVNGACTLTLVHTSTPVLPAPWFLGSRCQTVHAYTPTKCPVAACLWAIPATKLCLYHLGPSVYTCVTCSQSCELCELWRPHSVQNPLGSRVRDRWQETLPGPTSSLGPQNDPPPHPFPGPACKDTPSAGCPGLLGCRQSSQRRLAHPNSVTAAALAPSPLPCTQ